MGLRAAPTDVLAPFSRVSLRSTGDDLFFHETRNFVGANVFHLSSTVTSCQLTFKRHFKSFLYYLPVFCG